MHQIQKNECELLFRSKNFETYDTAFKTNYENEYHRYIIEEKQKYHQSDRNSTDACGVWIHDDRRMGRDSYRSYEEY